MSEFSQTVPELVAWARKNDFSISLPVDRLSFLLAVATLNGETAGRGNERGRTGGCVPPRQ